MTEKRKPITENERTRNTIQGMSEYAEGFRDAGDDDTFMFLRSAVSLIETKQDAIEALEHKLKAAEEALGLLYDALNKREGAQMLCDFGADLDAEELIEVARTKARAALALTLLEEMNDGR